MWKAYSADYMKNNRSSGLSVIIAAFISALLLSLLCGLFYNAWKYEVERIEREEGGWHSRITGEFDKEAVESVKNFAGIKDAVAEENGIDMYFEQMGNTFKDTPQIAEFLGVPTESITYHYGLLAMYLIRSSQDTAPRLLFPMYLLIMMLASFSLIAIIHHSFAVSMNARIHQFGILSSVGATPKQIRRCLLQEAAVLCALPVIFGNLLGIAGCRGILQMTNAWLGNDVAGRHDTVFDYHPLVFALTFFVTIVTIWISAWIPAGKLSKMTPLEAIRNTEERYLKRRKKSRILSRMFGIEGELAGNALKAQKKALRTASLSLLFSFMAFTIMQCFFATSKISTRETYFERYQDAWDIMVTVKNAEAASVDGLVEREKIGELPGAESVTVYQKAVAKRVITEEQMSEEMKSFGGFSQASERYVSQTDEGFLVNAPIVVLDDKSFFLYCEQIGVVPQLNGAVIYNRIRDVTNPDFRHPRYMPYVKEENTGENETSVLRRSDNEEMRAEIPIVSYTVEAPVLREEYATLDYYELVHFVPLSLWEEIKDRIGGAEEDTYIRVLGGENASPEMLAELQDKIVRLVGKEYTAEGENRPEAYAVNERQIQGMTAILGGFCVLLAIIGIGNVFSNTLGFVRQRKREVARYLSVGMTPEEIRKMFWIEAFVLAVRPILSTIPLAVAAVFSMLRMSYLGVGEFLEEAPFVPVFVFMLAIFASVAAAYYLGWRNMKKISLAEVLRDDTMM